MSLEQLLLARARLAKLGERSQLNWWPSDAHSQAGTLILNRLFPRTGTWGAVELAMEAAAAAHRHDLPAIRTVTLFDLGEKINRTLTDLLLQKKLQGAAVDPYVEPLASPTELATNEYIQSVESYCAKLSPGRSICVGEAQGGADWTEPFVWGRLVAGYQFSSPGKLVVPYLRVV